MNKTYRSDALAAIHETASDLHDAGVTDKRTVRDFDELCLLPVRPMTAADIRALRARERVSEAVFARYLNVTIGLVSQCERGEKHPAGAPLNLLNVVDRRGRAAIARPDTRAGPNIFCASSFLSDTFLPAMFVGRSTRGTLARRGCPIPERHG